MSNDQDSLEEVLAKLQAIAGWSERASRLAEGNAGLHLAVFVEPYLSLILEGQKTVESRFSRVRCAPYSRVISGDIVLLKRSGGPVLGAFLVGAVWSYEIDENSWLDIQDRFSEAICPQGPDFWEQRSLARYATLMKVKDAVGFGGVPWPKRDRRGWVVISKDLQLGFLP